MRVIRTIARRTFAWRCAALCAALCVAPALGTAQSVVEGRVVSRAGRPLSGAQVALPGLSLDIRTDSAGTFRFAAVPDGVHLMRVQLVGFAQVEQLVTAPVPSSIRIELAPATMSLAEVRVEGERVSPLTPGLAEFEERRALKRGRFITSEKFEQSNGSRLGDVLLRELPGLAFRPLRNGRALASRRGTVRYSATICYPAVWIDGAAQTTVTNEPFNIDGIDPTLVAAAEYHTAATLPGRYNRTGEAPCGALLLWLRH